MTGAQQYSNLEDCVVKFFLALRSKTVTLRSAGYPKLKAMC